jgi:glycosyltransferase involved in cell wall biosynthesis
MNIMQVISGRGVNGATHHCLLLTRELIRRGNEVTLLCRPGSWIARQLAPEALDVIFSDLHRWPVDELRRIAELLDRRGVEVVHTHMSRAHFFGVLLRLFSKTPCVATAHSRRFQLHWMFNDLVIAVSDATRRFHETYNLVPSDRIVTIHNFIDDGRIADVSRESRADVRRSLGVEGSAPLIGVIGSVLPKKGQIYLLRALPKILAAVPDTTLLVVGETGEAGYLERLKATAEELGVASRVAWAGHREDVHRILASLDLSVLPSLEESFPMSILEAMAAGLPVVASDVGGVRESVFPQQTGILVPPRDSDALAEAISGLLLDPVLRTTMGDAGRQLVRERFSTDSQAASIEAAFARVQRRHRAA